MAETLGLVSTLITALLGGGVSSALVTSVLEARRQERILLRNKLEELYTEFDKLARTMSDMHVVFKKYADDEIDLSTFMSEVKEIADALPATTIERVDSLSAIYFSDVTLVYKSFLTARKKFALITSDVKMILGNSSEFKLAVNESYEYLQEMDSLTRCAILKCAQRINLPIWKRLKELKIVSA